jgi:hypothetical protein
MLKVLSTVFPWPTYHVEIVHYDRCFGRSLFAIDPADPVVVVWDLTKEQILQLIGESQLGSSWALLSYLILGSRKQRHPQPS